ncbi:hypothetical protein [Lacrimispora sp. 210928-DFI.3.58]|uniref:hypothetical protein n=1 Tax=Lacrimispora sp. 210928-DFI.3.58 TaxID=2883214 RepID=UPI0015B4EF93|nr:hypothetical protein [Lacrimispora sp. 210928-DFI.3.58]MCB7320702.1 hypothetical protein [Lacrimispora sp. 210928-DFI.3.58]
MNFYKNHYGMIISSVVAYFISLLMATCAIFVDHLTFSIPLLVKNWGTAFLVISVSGMVFPLTNWSFALGRRLGLKPETLPHVLLENFIATMVFNTTATLVLAGVNIYGNPAIEAAVAAGAAPSVTAIYIGTLLHDWPVMFVISFIAAFFVTKLAIHVAQTTVGGPLITKRSPQNAVNH